MPSPRPMGRPKIPLLSQEGIIQGALFVLAETGAEDFTMGRLATHLGVQTPALYKHVKNRRDLVNLIRMEIAANIDSSAFETLPWREAMLPWARSYRLSFARNPHAITLLATIPMDGNPSSLRMYEPVVRGMQRGGWPIEEIVPAIVAVESFIVGSSLDVLADPDNLSPKGDTETAPTFGAAVAARDAEDTRLGRGHADHAFEVGLAALVRGLDPGN